MFERVKQTVRGIREGLDWHKSHPAPKQGEPAPDFELCDVDGKNPIRLSSLRGERPVALVFGSFT